MLRPSLLLLLLAAVSSACAQTPAAPSRPVAQDAAQEAPTVAEHVLPAVRVRDYWILPLALDGRDGSDGQEERILWVLYDTGASTTVLDPESLQAVSDWSPNQGRRVNLVKATIGPATVTNLSATVRDLDHIEDALGFELDGILGYSTFSGTLLTLDYPRGEMRVRQGELPKADGETIFAITRKERRRPFIEFQFGEREEEVLIDSGSGAGFVLEDRAGRELLGKPVPLNMMMGINGPRAEPFGRLDGQAELFGRRFSYPIVRLTQGTELLGTQVLRHFSMTFDIDRRRVQIQGAGADFEDGVGPIIPPEELWASGLLKSATPEGHRIRGLVPDSPAAASGLREGDHIVVTNRVPYAERGGEPMVAWRDGARRYHQLQVERDGEQFELELEQASWLPLPEGVLPAAPRHALPRDLVLRIHSPVAPTETELTAPEAQVAAPDGSRSAHILDSDGQSMIRVVDDRGRILSNPVTRGRIRGLQWSSDSRWLAFWVEVEENGELVWSRWAVPANGAQAPESVPTR